MKEIDFACNCAFNNSVNGVKFIPLADGGYASGSGYAGNFRSSSTADPTSYGANGGTGAGAQRRLLSLSIDLQCGFQI